MNFLYRGIFGFDISTYQDSPLIVGHVDFHKMKAYGARFVIIKAGQATYRDPDFEKNWQGAKGILPRASYWYYDNTVSPKVQAGAYRDIMEGRVEGLCFLDLEDRTPGDYMGWRAWYDFIENFKTFLPEAQIGVYTGHYYFEEFTMSATDAQREYFKQYPLWIAAYTQDPFKPNYAVIRIPRPFTSCILHQSGTPAIGRAAGVESEDIDYNRINGDETEFAKYFTGVVPQPEPDPDNGTGEPMPTKYIGLVKSTAPAVINIRSTPNGADIGDIERGTAFEGVGELVSAGGFTWMQWVRPVAGWVATINLDYQVVTPTPEPSGLPVFNVDVTVSGAGYVTQKLIVEMRPE